MRGVLGLETRLNSGDIFRACETDFNVYLGDIESAPFVESMRQLRMKAGSKENFLHLHVTVSLFAPFVSSTDFTGNRGIQSRMHFTQATWLTA